MSCHRLHLSHLVMLEVLLVERSLTRAAELLHVTQPAISNALTKLREHYGDELLIRNGRDMQPTPFAVSLLKPLQESLQRVRAIELAKPGFDPACSSREFKIVTSEYVATVFLTELICHIEKVAPSVTITYIPIGEESLQMFQQGNADAVVFPDGELALARHPKRELFSERWVCIARKDNSSVGVQVTAEEIAELPRVFPMLKHYVVDRGTDLTFSKPPLLLPSSAVPWFVASSDYVSVIPDRLASIYASVLPLKRVEMRPKHLRKIIVQWHAEMMENRFQRWMLEQLQHVGEAIEKGNLPTFQDSSGVHPIAAAAKMRVRA